MKTKLFAAALAALTLASAGAASAQDWRGRGDGWRRPPPPAEITVRTAHGREIAVQRGERLFYRLQERPYHFEPGLTYAYTDRCNRNGCVAFVFVDGRRRPIDRIFAPHLPHRLYAWRHARDFDREYRDYGRYQRDDRWHNDDDQEYRRYRDEHDDDDDDDDRQRDGRRGDRSGLDGGPRHNR
jgi:hypothetical protein